MGVIRELSDDAGNGGGGSDDPRPAHHSSPDPFLPEYDTGRIKVDVDTADTLIGLAVVVSNLWR